MGIRDRLAGARSAAEMWSEESSVGRPASEVLADRVRVEALLERLGSGSRISTDRTPEFLHWRYRFAPPRYRAISLGRGVEDGLVPFRVCLFYTSPSPRNRTRPRMPSSA